MQLLKAVTHKYSSTSRILNTETSSRTCVSLSVFSDSCARKCESSLGFYREGGGVLYVLFKGRVEAWPLFPPGTSSSPAWPALQSPLSKVNHTVVLSSAHG